MRQFPEAMPFIDVDSDASPEVHNRIKSFDDSIRRDPNAYLEALDTLGDELIDPTQSVVEQHTHNRIINPEITRQIIDYFFERDDRKINFDPVTEQLIRANETHQKLLADARAANQAPIRAGRENPEAVIARDAMRRFRLRFYVGQVASFQAQQQTESPKAKETSLINS